MGRQERLFWVLPVTLALVLVSSLVGILIDSRGFLVNLLAGIVGIIMSFAFALWIADRYILYQRQKQWDTVAAFTLRAIAIHLCEITGSLWFHYTSINGGPATDLFGGHQTSPDPKLIKSFESLVDELRRLPSTVSRDKSTSDIAIEYYDAIRWDLDQIQTVLTPRVLQFPVEQSLIDRLIEFDDARRELHHSIIGHKQVVTHSVFPRVVRMITCAGLLYAEICRQTRLNKSFGIGFKQRNAHPFASVQS